LAAITHIPVRLTRGEAMVRGLNGYDILLLQDTRRRADARQAIDLAARLGSIDSDEISWPDVERVLLAAFLQSFGVRAELIAPCPDCDETIEIAPDLRDLLAEDPAGPEDVVVQGWQLRSGPPTARAMARAALSAPRIGAEVLRASMVLSAEDPDGRPRPVADVPAAVLDEAFGQTNIAGFLIFEMTCPACETAMVTRLDALELLRSEAALAGDIGARARTLSSRLGMSLPDILDLPDAERRSLSRLVAEAAA